MTMDIRREEGIALIVAMMAMLLMTALGVALVLTTSSETLISSNFRNGGEALYAADAVVERALDDLLTVPDWNTLLSGSVQSAFVDGPPSGARTLPDGSTINLSQGTEHGELRKNRRLHERQHGRQHPAAAVGAQQSTLAAVCLGKLSDMMPTSASSVLLRHPDGCRRSVRERQRSEQGRLRRRKSRVGHPGGKSGGVRAAGRTQGRRDHGGAHRHNRAGARIHLGQRGQDEQNRRARKAAVQTPGKTLQMQTLTLGSGGVL